MVEVLVDYEIAEEGEAMITPFEPFVKRGTDPQREGAAA